MFDVLVQIYEEYGYTVSEAVRNIVEKNIYGLDIDNRAAQLAYFSVMMKARSYDRRFFARKDTDGQLNIPQPNIMSVFESNGIREDSLKYLGGTLPSDKKAKAYKEALQLKKEFNDAKEYGSILKVSDFDWQLLNEFVKDNNTNGQQRLDVYGELEAANIISSLISVGIILTQKYDVVVTNPPYLNSNRFSPMLDKYVNANYPDEKTDLSMVMLRKALDDFCKPDGFVSFITTSSWMFLQSFEKVRRNILNGHCIDSIVDYGTELFEGKVGHNPITSWVSRKSKVNKKMTALRLVEFCYSRRDEKEPEFFNEKNRYYTSQDAFEVIPGTPIAYWASNSMIDAFKTGQCVNGFANPKQGLATADNKRFLRLWFEVSGEDIYLECSDHENAFLSNKKWYPYNKGGGFKKWYGNNAYLINWQHDGAELKAFKGSVIRSPQFYFRECGSWCKVTSASFSMRYIPKGFLFDVAGCSLFVDDNNLKYVIAFMNSKVNKAILGLISPTLNYEVGHVASLPVIFDETQRERIEALCEDSIRICKEDWDSFELSWDFRRHPLIRDVSTVEEAYKLWDNECKDRFAKLKGNEEELNRIFIDIYNMQEDMNPEENDDEVTVRLANKQREIKSLISYAVGCMFGRYSLDKDGVLYAGGRWDASSYQRFKVDDDNIIPICDDEYFSDDIVSRFISFIKTVYGEHALEENLNYIAECLGGRGSSRDIIRNYFINDFYSEHCSVYSVAGSGKRPIYWQFDSGKKNGFKCLIYLHRYRPDTIARIRTDYVHEQQSRYRTAIESIESQISEASTSDRVKLNKKLALLNEQASEIRSFEEKIHHLADQMIHIDLDDGIKSNYAILKDVLSKIK